MRKKRKIDSIVKDCAEADNVLKKDKSPQTLAVYFHLSKEFAIEENDQGTVFIGRHDFIYTDVMKKTDTI